MNSGRLRAPELSLSSLASNWAASSSVASWPIALSRPMKPRPEMTPSRAKWLKAALISANCSLLRPLELSLASSCCRRLTFSSIASRSWFQDTSRPAKVRVVCGLLSTLASASFWSSSATARNSPSLPAFSPFTLSTCARRSVRSPLALFSFWVRLSISASSADAFSAKLTRSASLACWRCSSASTSLPRSATCAHTCANCASTSATDGAASAPASLICSPTARTAASLPSASLWPAATFWWLLTAASACSSESTCFSSVASSSATSSHWLSACTLSAYSRRRLSRLVCCCSSASAAAARSASASSLSTPANRFFT
mmetsp:Transcript_42042/g.106053  ORF Transcript_42042/g.106053 Transcript_42042/m.106053 type:complete len:316 (+) Transcript_42042:285-1232(+)